ncbi:MAG: RNase adapter RapZ, partial [Rhodospirillales bacterium]
YSETRRRHPMRESLNIYESIAIERAALSEVRERANLILDTSHMKSHELKERLGQLILHRDIELDMVVEVMSFGFKNGVPLDADFVFDVRFLANPHYDPALRPQTGLDAPVADYVFAQPEAVQLLDSIASLMERWIPMHAKAGKARLTIGIGCTGGQHRSVAIAKSLADRLDQKFNFVSEVHRDIRPIGSAHN